MGICREPHICRTELGYFQTGQIMLAFIGLDIIRLHYSMLNVFPPSYSYSNNHSQKVLGISYFSYSIVDFFRFL